MNVVSCERCRREDLMGAAVGLWAGADPTQSVVLAAAAERGRLCGLCATTAGRDDVVVRDVRIPRPAPVFSLRVPEQRRTGPKHLRTARRGSGSHRLQFSA